METTSNGTALSKVAEVELIYRNKVKASERPAIATSKDCYHLLRQSWDENKIELLEQFKILLLNRGNKVLGIFEVSAGGITGTVVDPRIIFSAALKANATSIILAHNHPSGNLKPSAADKELTSRMKAAGQILEIRVWDHLIITNDGYFSFADEGLM